jgi:hypothetical protein
MARAPPVGYRAKREETRSARDEKIIVSGRMTPLTDDLEMLENGELNLEGWIKPVGQMR